MKNKKFSGILFLGVAIISIIFAMICFDMYDGNYESDIKYGGDAYTGIQNAAAQTANNVMYTNRCIKTIGGFAFIIIGLVLGTIGVDCLLANKLVNKESEQKSTEETYDSVTQDIVDGVEDYDDLPQVVCPNCGIHHDYDYPKCPKCKYKYDIIK